MSGAAVNIDAPAPENMEAQRSRLAWEAEQTEEGLADVRAGRIISHEAVKAWVASWGTANELPPPEPGQ